MATDSKLKNGELKLDSYRVVGCRIQDKDAVLGHYLKKD